MAVNVDNVYQKVLAICNKEQRGYITPQEFNLMADRAQFQIFDDYFHDIRTAYYKPGNVDEGFDGMTMLKEKLNMHRSSNAITPPATAGDPHTLPAGVYRLMNVYSTGNLKKFHEITEEERIMMGNNLYTSPTAMAPCFVRTSDTELVCYPATDVALTADYISVPTTPNWGYVVVNDNALYNPNTSTNFDLHESEEERLVNKILEYAGIIMVKTDIAQAGIGMQQRQELEDNN